MMRVGLSLSVLRKTSNTTTPVTFKTAIQRQKSEAQRNQRYKRASWLTPSVARVATTKRPASEIAKRIKAVRRRMRSAGWNTSSDTAITTKITTAHTKTVPIPDACCTSCQKVMLLKSHYEFTDD